MDLSMLRKKCGYSQMEFAEKLNIKQNTVSMWETNRASPRLNMISDIAKVLDVSIEEIVECFQKSE